MRSVFGSRRGLRAAIAAGAACLLVGTVAPAGAAVFLIDLNENAGAGGPGGTWNTYAAPTNITGATIVESTGAASAVTFNKSGTISDNTANSGVVVFDPAQSGVANLPSWAVGNSGTASDDDAAGDNFFTANTNAVVDSFTLTFGGLAAGSTVSLDLLASRNSGSAFGFYEYSLDGGTTWTGFRVLNANGAAAATDGWDTKTTANSPAGQSFSLQSQGFTLHRYMNADGLTLTGPTLGIRVTDGNATASTFAAVNAIRLTVVPEPATLGLLFASAAAVGVRRRRRGS